MGNIEQKIQQISKKQHTYKHFNDTRSDSQIEITNRLTNLLSDINTQRINRCKVNSSASLDWFNYVFFCVQGLPAPKNQFDVLELPGQTRYFGAINFIEQAINYEQKIRQNNVYESTFKKEATRLRNAIQQIPADKKVVLIYHSAGNYMISMYFYYFGNQLGQRLKGMIDIAGGPLRFYPSSKIFIPVVLNTDFKEIMDNRQKIHKFFLKVVSSTGFNLGYRDKYETLSFLHYIQSPDFDQVFNSTWNHPKTLKLIIHGRNDTFFDSTLLNQKAIYYTYIHKIDEQNEKKLKQKYQIVYENEKVPKDLQQRFILAIPKGQHSVHRQTKNQELIRRAVHQYLTIIHQ